MKCYCSNGLSVHTLQFADLTMHVAGVVPAAESQAGATTAAAATAPNAAQLVAQPAAGAQAAVSQRESCILLRFAAWH